MSINPASAPYVSYSRTDGSLIRAIGVPMAKKPNPVYLHRVDGPFVVHTAEGPLRCEDGYVAFDPMSGHVWPVDAEYVAMHYEPV